MRSVAPLILAAALASCSTAPPPPSANFNGQRQVGQWLAGLVPGAPVSCLSSFHQKEMAIADDSTVAFRAAPGHVWVQKTQSPCSPLAGPGPYALVTHSTVGSLCRGDIATVVDTASGMNVGSCVMGDFIPYSRPR